RLRLAADLDRLLVAQEDHASRDRRGEIAPVPVGGGEEVLQIFAGNGDAGPDSLDERPRHLLGRGHSLARPYDPEDSSPARALDSEALLERAEIRIGLTEEREGIDPLQG